MSVRASAARYARALLDVSIAERVNLEQVEQELAGFAGLFTTHQELRVLLNPAIPAAQKRAVMQELVNRAKPTAPLGKLLLMLAERDRLELLPDLLSVYRERLMDHQQIVRADVTTAAPLDPAKAAQLQQRLAEVTGRRVAMSTKVDPSIIGGVVARIGSTVYDGSVVTQLAKMREKLVQQG